MSPNPLKIIGILAAGLILMSLLAVIYCLETDPQAESSAAIQPAPVPTEPPKKVGLDITIHKWDKDEYGYGKVVYSITNTGDIEVEYLKIKIIIKDKAGTPLSVHTTYPCPGSTLRPGQEVVDEYPFMDYDMVGASGVSIEIMDYWEV